ncbi:MAG: CPBP family intramembrane metalloprotease [Cytophagaceae bacterium]|nr:CPBP family intramembrane metalloprotease [Cytophagaceae bacterium]
MENQITPQQNKTLQSFGVILRLFGFRFLGEGIILTVFAAIFGTDYILSLDNNPPPSDSRPVLLSMQVSIHLISFILLPLIYIKYINPKIKLEISLKKNNTNGFLIMILFAVLLIILSQPLVDVINKFNQNIKLPDILGFENTAKNLEEKLKILMRFLIQYDSIPEFIMLLFIIAIIPAIGEEFLFRGIAQNELIKIWKTPHFPIWITAFFFSFLHFQFMGFFPRMFLGVVFGYLYYWSGSLLIPICMHFINNAMALILNNLHMKKIIDFDPESVDFPAIIIIVCLVVFLLLLFTFRRFSEKSKQDILTH